MADVLPSIQGTPSVESPWYVRFKAGNAWHWAIAWSGVEGQVCVQNWSVFSVAIALDWSPSPMVKTTTIGRFSEGFAHPTKAGCGSQTMSSRDFASVMLSAHRTGKHPDRRKLWDHAHGPRSIEQTAEAASQAGGGGGWKIEGWSP
jgi:hypothetical protein